MNDNKRRMCVCMCVYMDDDDTGEKVMKLNGMECNRKKGLTEKFLLHT